VTRPSGEDGCVLAQLVMQEPSGPTLEAARTVYAAAFGQPPYREGPEQVAAFVDRVRRYARERDGLRLVLVDDDGPAGLGLAVLARPGDWWRDRAAETVGPQQAERWMPSPCLEIVHVAVHPERQRKGIGRLVHDLLIAGTPAPTAILSCNPEAEPARRLYARRGWRVLAGGAALLMGRDL
jgi:GNAT superfamily N-acetyltransferase